MRRGRQAAAETKEASARSRGVGAALALGAALTLPGTASAQQASAAYPAYRSGLSYIIAFGPKQYPVLTLLLAMTALMLAIIVIIAVLVLVGVIRRRAPADTPAEVPIARTGNGLLFIYIGIGMTVPVLLGISAWTYAVLAQVSAPPGKPALTVQVTGHQWWWEFRYVGARPDQAFTTANEMHIPVGKPVRIELATADVIHSFWVPALSGKTDTIAGQHNVTWIEADAPGTYRGQCTEYCGLQHAHMGLLVIADPPEQFQAWWDRQLQGPALPDTEPGLDEVLQGQADFMRNCAVCHSVRGTSAGGRVGPDLSHLMERRTLAAATLPNTIGDLSGWISSPQHLKPGNYMPTLSLSAPELARIRTFLAALK